MLTRDKEMAWRYKFRLTLLFLIKKRDNTKMSAFDTFPKLWKCLLTLSCNVERLFDVSINTKITSAGKMFEKLPISVFYLL